MWKEHLSGAWNGVIQGKKGMIGVVKRGHFRIQHNPYFLGLWFVVHETLYFFLFMHVAQVGCLSIST